MRFSIAVAVALATAVQAFAPAAKTPFSTSRLLATPTDHEKSSNKKGPWWGPAATAFAGLTLASQIAVASVPAIGFGVQDHFVSAQTTTTLSVNFETMDFAMPSYESATKGDISTPKINAPAFNPFGDFDFNKGSAAPTVEEDAAPTKAELKAAAEAKKAEEKAEAEAKKAEKQARLAEEKEKQKAAVERTKEAPAPVESSAPPALNFDMPSFKAPDLDIKMPDMPKMEMPKMEMPKMDMPNFDMPKMEMPKMEMPKMDMPKMEMPKFDMPKMEMPKMPSAGGGEYNLEIPKFEAPDIALPKMDMPKIDMPKLPAFFGDSSEKVIVGSQEERDESAREARKVFLAADGEAKEAEEAARAVREIANGKKKLANEAKDLACDTRPGGKWICLRNPFSAGF